MTCVCRRLGTGADSIRPKPEQANARGLGLFRDYIEPMFKRQCYECHSHEYEEASGGLVVDSRAAMLKGGDLGPSLVPGKPDESLLLEALLYENDAIANAARRQA